MAPSRDRTIDTLRGLAILCMVFFTLIMRFGQGLPDPLRHNQPGSVHAGDLVLPLFLFTSGLSIVHYLDHRSHLSSGELLREGGQRFAKLALVGLLLSSYSAGGWLEMDEVMLSGLLFLACLIFGKLTWRLQMALVGLLTLVYLPLERMGGVQLMEDHYLGGYASVPFYFLVMYAGLILGQGARVGGYAGPPNRTTLGLMLCLLIVAWILYPLEKFTATPTYMLVSVMACFCLLVTMEQMGSKIRFVELEYLGRKPLRFWIMLYLFVLIPNQEHWDMSGERYMMEWQLAVAFSLAVMLGLWIASKMLDKLLLLRVPDTLCKAS